MKKLLIGCMVGVFPLLAAPAAWGQVYFRPVTNPYGAPTVSPYLNLFRGGAPAGLNYYNLVRPQIDTAASIYQLQQNPYVRSGVSLATDPYAGAVTGHPTRFFNYSHYFFNPGGGATPTVGGVPPAVAGALPASPFGVGVVPGTTTPGGVTPRRGGVR
jgi:hypothetical protein